MHYQFVLPPTVFDTIPASDSSFKNRFTHIRYHLVRVYTDDSAIALTFFTSSQRVVKIKKLWIGLYKCHTVKFKSIVELSFLSSDDFYYAFTHTFTQGNLCGICNPFEILFAVTRDNSIYKNVYVFCCIRIQKFCIVNDFFFQKIFDVISISFVNQSGKSFFHHIFQFVKYSTGIIFVQWDIHQNLFPLLNIFYKIYNIGYRMSLYFIT